MNKKIVCLFSLSAFLFSGCSFYKDKMAGYYLSKAEKIAAEEEASEEEIDSVYECLSRAVEYKPNLPKSVEVSEKITEASIKSGYKKAYELQIEFIKKYLKLNPYSWDVHLNLISAYSLKGDLRNLDFLIGEFENMERYEQDEKNKFSFLVLREIAHSNILPWIESQGYLSANVNSDHIVTYLSQYRNYMDKAEEIRKSLEDPKRADLKKSMDRLLADAYEVSVAEAFKNKNEIRRNRWISEKINSDQKFLKALKYTVEGNVYLLKKDYSSARILYKSALSNHEGFINAKKQMVEVDFQEAMSLALMKRDNTELKDSLYSCYDEINDMIEDSPSYFSRVPFVSNEKFLSDLYSLKAALISALMTVENFSPKKKRKIQAEFKTALDKAIEINPQNKLAKEIFERYRKDGI